MVKDLDSIEKTLMKLLDLRLGEVSGIAGGGVKSVDIGRNTKGEGNLLEQF